MNRRIAMSAFSILSALALLGGGAFAAFTVSATATNSTFSTANPLLHICEDSADSPVNCGTSINGFNVAGIVPGTPKTFKFWLRNAGTLSDGSLDLSGFFRDVVGTGVGNFDGHLQVGLACDNGGAVTASTLFTTWVSTTQVFGGSSLAPNGGQTQCTMTVLLPSGNPGDVNKSLVFNAEFDGTAGN